MHSFSQTNIQLILRMIFFKKMKKITLFGETLQNRTTDVIQYSVAIKLHAAQP